MKTTMGNSGNMICPGRSKKSHEMRASPGDTTGDLLYQLTRNWTEHLCSINACGPTDCESLSEILDAHCMANQKFYGFEARKHGVPPMGHIIFTSDEAQDEVTRKDQAAAEAERQSL